MCVYVCAGTLSDKVAALALMVQEAPMMRLKTLDMLMGLASRPDRRCAQMALEACKVRGGCLYLFWIEVRIFA